MSYFYSLIFQVYLKLKILYDTDLIFYFILHAKENMYTFTYYNFKSQFICLIFALTILFYLVTFKVM